MLETVERREQQQRGRYSKVYNRDSGSFSSVIQGRKFIFTGKGAGVVQYFWVVRDDAVIKCFPD